MSINNPILKTLKEGDIVMVELVSKNGKPFKQICQLSNLKYFPADETYDSDWLEFKTEVLYTNFRMSPNAIYCIGNCLAITEVIPKELVQIYVTREGMWNPEQYPLSDEEVEYHKNRIELDLKYFELGLI